MKKYRDDVLTWIKKTENIIIVVLILLILLDIFVITKINYGWWLFFCFVLWVMVVFLVWHVLYTKVKIKRRIKNPYSPLFINAMFLIFTCAELTKRTTWFFYTWLFIKVSIIIFIFLLWFDYLQKIKGKNEEPLFSKWLSGKRYRFLQIIMIFLIVNQSFVTFPYVFEPFLRWKVEQSADEMQKVVNDLIDKYNCRTDEEKTIVLLNWFERYSGNILNNWGLPTLYTPIPPLTGVHPLYFSFGDGHPYSLVYCCLYMRPINRDLPRLAFITRAGRCEERSILFREMASAAGLKVRSVIGPDIDHTWAEVKIGDEWITVDPSNVVHNRIWKDNNYTGYNLSRKYFVKRFSYGEKINLIYAEYLNGTKVPVTDRYINDTRMVNITVIDESGKPVKGAEISFHASPCPLADEYGYRLKTDDKGKCSILLGNGTIFIKACTDGFIYKDGGKLINLRGKEEINVVIRVRNNCLNVTYCVSAAIIVVPIILIKRYIKIRRR